MFGHDSDTQIQPPSFRRGRAWLTIRGLPTASTTASSFSRAASAGIVGAEGPIGAQGLGPGSLVGEGVDHPHEAHAAELQEPHEGEAHRAGPNTSTSWPASRWKSSMPPYTSRQVHKSAASATLMSGSTRR